MRILDARRGITLIETLVIITILGLLLAMSAVALTKVREAACIAQSKNNLAHSKNVLMPLRHSFLWYLGVVAPAV